LKGESEQILLEGITKRFYEDKPNIKVIPANGFVSQAGRVIDAINKLYAPLSPIYGGKIVILLDAPNSRELAGYQAFRKQYGDINVSGRMFDLGVDSLEAYYPQTLIEGRNVGEKKKLAKYVSNNITKEQFEAEMPIVFSALQKCWELSYGVNAENQAES
jgi:putative ATP-dependent endonuclease of OLD family